VAAGDALDQALADLDAQTQERAKRRVPAPQPPRSPPVASTAAGGVGRPASTQAPTQSRGGPTLLQRIGQTAASVVDTIVPGLGTALGMVAQHPQGAVGVASGILRSPVTAGAGLADFGADVAHAVSPHADPRNYQARISRPGSSSATAQPPTPTRSSAATSPHWATPGTTTPTRSFQHRLPRSRLRRRGQARPLRRGRPQDRAGSPRLRQPHRPRRCLPSCPRRRWRDGGRHDHGPGDGALLQHPPAGWRPHRVHRLARPQGRRRQAGGPLQERRRGHWPRGCCRWAVPSRTLLASPPPWRPRRGRRYPGRACRQARGRSPRLHH
jgi:hypothetical protein